MSDSLQDVLAIDGGEAYIISLIPEAAESFKNHTKKFRLREEKTASTSVFKHSKQGHWMVKDHGSSDPAMHAIGLRMYLNGEDFVTALHDAARFYKLEDGPSVTVSADYNSRAAKPDEQPNQYAWELKEFDLFELKTIFAEGAWLALGKDDEDRKKAAVQLCGYYHLKAVKWFSKVDSDGTRVHIFGSNERFPIFMFDEGEFQKLYKPKDEKQFRFVYIGKKADRFIHGLEQHRKKYETRQAEAKKAYSEALDRGEKNVKLEESKLPEIILCTGGSDALNVAALGHDVIWLNSETAEFSYQDYKAVCRIAELVYNLPDIDTTGIEEARKLAIKYLDLRTIWLPDELRKKTDWRGNPCKDVRDYLRYWRKRDFKGLFETAYQFKFWDEEIAYDKGGFPKYKFGRLQMSYAFSNLRGYNFLQHMGFGKLASEKEKEGFFYVRITDGRVKRVEVNEVEGFIHSFLEEYTFPDGSRVGEDLRNVIYRSPQVSGTSLSKLRKLEPDFRYFGPHHQYIFFSYEKNGKQEPITWKVTANKVEEIKRPDVCVWDAKVLRIQTLDKNDNPVVSKPKLLPPFFQITQAEGEWDIQIKDNQCDFLKFLIQTSKVHWRRELEERLEFWKLDSRAQADHLEKYGMEEADRKRLLQFQNIDRAKAYQAASRFKLDGELLLPEEVADQKLALINKIFVIGYMLHRYKDIAKSWVPFCMDYRMSETGASNGGAGKGLLAKALYKWLNTVTIDGRDQKIFEDKHLYENVDTDTDMIHFEDWGEYQTFEKLYIQTTSSLTVNPKNKRAIILDYKDYGKFWIDTNYGDRSTDQSSKRRKIYVVFSDFYHEDLAQYREVRTPLTEFGRRIFEDWDADEWNRFHNFFAQCLAFYLTTVNSFVKIEPPTENVNKRNLLSLMGENFHSWADVYFAPESNRLNNYVQRVPALEDFNRETRLKVTPQMFTKKLAAWAQYNHYELNPADLLDKRGRIIRTIDVTDRDGTKRQTTAEMLYIRTSEERATPKKDDFPAPLSDNEIDF
ncbi:MAG: hypothetical protein U0X91_20850 [Spirosomataceae bacterium]